MSITFNEALVNWRTVSFPIASFLSLIRRSKLLLNILVFLFRTILEMLQEMLRKTLHMQATESLQVFLALITFGLVTAFVAKFGIAGSFSIIYNVTSELYPTVIRSNGVGMGSFAARIGGVLAPYILELQNYVVWLPNTIFGVLSIAGGLMSLTFPETNGHVMMETIDEAERFYRGRSFFTQSDATENSVHEELATKTYSSVTERTRL